MNEFLASWPEKQRSLIANQFCYAVRDGCKTPEAVVAWVAKDAERRGGWANTDQGQNQLLSVIEHPAALEYAQTIIDREALPYQERLKTKTERQQHFRDEYMAQQPPTDKQLDYLRALGCEIIPTSKLEASKLIDDLS